MHQATKGISDLITIPGLINCDFADVRTVMLERGDALMGTGLGVGEDRAVDAATAAISSPLLEDVSISGAKGVLINVTGGEEMTLFDVNAATSLVYEAAGNDANIIFGAVIDPNMNDQMRVTVIATGFPGHEKHVRVEEEKVPAEIMAKPISLFPEQSYSAPRQTPPVPEPVETAVESVVRPASGGEFDDGNGNGSGARSRVPLFSEDDRTIPAYIRRLEDR